MLSKRFLTVLTLTFILAGCVAPSVPPCQEQIELRNGKVIKDTILSFKDDTFTLKEEEKVSREEVKEIKFIRPISKERPSQKEPVILAREVQEYLTKAKEASQKYPQANGIILLDDGYDILNPDGSRSYRYHFIGKILTNKTKSWASRRLYLQEERYRVKVILARTITPEGQIFELDKSDIKIAAPARGMAFFGRGKVMSFTLPQVELGSLVEYIYEYENFNPWDKNIFEPGFRFQATEPVILSKLTVTIPSEKSLNYYAKNMPSESAQPTITKGNGMTSYIWEMRNLEAIIEEPYMPALSDISPRIEGTLFKDWEYLHNWGTKKLSERMKVTPELEKVALEITKEVQTIEDKIAALYYFVQRKIRYISIKGSMSSGMAGHPAYQTLQNKYGDCIDKAVLFATMLKAIGVEAYPVIVRTNTAGTAIREIPILGGNHAINEIHLKGKVFYLDPVTRGYRYPYFATFDHGITAVNDITRKINFIEVPPPHHNMNVYSMEMAIEPDGDTMVKTQGDYTGSYEAGLRGYWESVPEGQRLDKFQQHINAISPGGKLTEFNVINLYEISKPLKMVYKYTLPHYPVIAGNLMIFGIPGLERSFPEIALDERKYNIEYSTSRNTKYEVKIKIPEGWQIKYPPESVKLECNPYASYEASYDDQAGYIVFKDDFKRFKRIIQVKDYQAYKKFLQDVARFSREKIFLTKEDKP